MIWLSGRGGYVLTRFGSSVFLTRSVRHSIQPVGSQILSGIELAGHSWNLWKGPNANWEVLSFVSADGDITDFNADLKDFFDYLVENQGVAGTQVRLCSAVDLFMHPDALLNFAVRPGDSDRHGAVHRKREPVHRKLQRRTELLNSRG